MGEKLQMKQHCPHPDLLQVDPFEAIIDEELEPGDILYIPPGFPNGRFVAGALALGFVSLPLLAWIAQSPIIIITGEQLSSYEYGLLQVPIFGALIAGNLLLARLTSRRTVRSLIIMGGWPIIIGLLVAAAATVISSHAYLWMTAGLSIYAFGIGLANAGLVRLTLFASDMSKGTVSAAMGMLQMLIYKLRNLSVTVQSV